MNIWDMLVEPLRIALFGLTHLWGGSAGAAILTLSILVRLALLPLTLRAAHRARVLGDAMKRMQPELERLRAKHAADPARMATELGALYRRHGVRPFRDSGWRTALIQLPIVAALFTVVRGSATMAGRFLWMRSLARPDALLAIVVATLAGGAVMAAPATGNQAAPRILALLSMGFTLFVLWRTAAAVGLYWGASSAVGIAQGLILRRTAAAARTQ